MSSASPNFFQSFPHPCGSCGKSPQTLIFVDDYSVLTLSEKTVSLHYSFFGPASLLAALAFFCASSKSGKSDGFVKLLREFAATTAKRGAKWSSLREG
jgi:hypothetical protein